MTSISDRQKELVNGGMSVGAALQQARDEEAQKINQADEHLISAFLYLRYIDEYLANNTSADGGRLGDRHYANAMAIAHGHTITSHAIEDLALRDHGLGHVIKENQ